MSTAEAGGGQKRPAGPATGMASALPRWTVSGSQNQAMAVATSVTAPPPKSAPYS